MATKQLWSYEPDYAVPPGETLEETLEALGMSQKELAQRMGRPPQIVNEIIKGKRALTPETALQLERVLGVPAHFWNNLESHYQTTKLRLQEAHDLEQASAWVQSFRYPELVKKGFVAAADSLVERARNLSIFFGVAGPKQQRSYFSEQAVDFRRSATFECDESMLAVWLRAGELAATNVKAQPYDKAKFLEALATIRTLTSAEPKEYTAQVQQLCALAGVVVVWIPELSKCPVSGATRWLREDCALIQLSLRYKADDQMWFSFFHEAGHIVLHQKRSTFIDVGTHEGKLEEEADQFARKQLIADLDWNTFVSQGQFTKTAICSFATAQGIAPSIVAGRLGHEGLLSWKTVQGMKLRKTLTWDMEN